MSDLTESQPGSPSGNYDLLDRLADEFAERFRKGERPSLKEYADRYPELADDIRAIFPAMVNLEQAEEVRHEGASGSPKIDSSHVPVMLTQVGDYRILRKIGHGGMGIVYEAEQVSLGRRVALKILPRNIALDGKMLERFRREARSAARLHHTNIVPVFEVGREGEVCFYAMQFIQGQGLDLVYDEVRKLRGRATAGKKDRGERSNESVDATRAMSDEAAASGAHGASSAAVNRTALNRSAVSLVVNSLMNGRFGAEHQASALVLPGHREEWRTLGGLPDPRGSSATSAYSETSGIAQTEAAAASLGDGTAPLEAPLSWSLSAPGLSASNASSAVLPGGTQISSIGSGRSEYSRSIARIGLQTAQALAYAHMRGVIHRDIKPSNLLLDTDGVVWITDFGLAKADDDGLTQTGDVLGTLRYMAPERFRGEGDGRADVYALGLTLYELLTLEPAFDTNDRLKLIEQVKSEEPIRPLLHDRRIPRDLETIVLKSIEKDQRQRYSTADEMAEDLRRFLDDEPILARRATVVERYARWARRNPGVAILGGVLSAVLALATMVSLLAAGRMALLAENERNAAMSERAAKIDAQAAQKQAVADRKAAEKAGRDALAALKEVDTQRTKADEQRDLAEANFQRALGTVDQYFIKVSESQLLSVPGLQPLRADLLKSALSFYEDYLKSHRQDPKLKFALAAVHLKAAKIHIELGQPVEAEKAYKDALPLYESLVATDPNDIEASSGLAECNLGLGTLGTRDDEHSKMLLRAIQSRELLVAARPGDPRLREDLARAYQALGELEMERQGRPTLVQMNGATQWMMQGGRVREALDAFLKAREIEASLVRDFTGNPAYQYELAQTLGQIAECLCKLGRHPDETIVRPLAIEHAKSAYEQSPTVVAYGRLCARLLRRDGNNLFSQKREEASLKSYLEAGAILEKLVRANPAVPSLATDFVQHSDWFIRDLNRLGKRPDWQLHLRRAIATLESLPDQGPNILACRARLLEASAKNSDPSASAEADQARKKRESDLAADLLKQSQALASEAKATAKSADIAKNPTEVEEKAGVGSTDRNQHQAELAATQYAIGLVQWGLGDRSEAMKTLQQAIDLRLALVRAEPKNSSYLTDLIAIKSVLPKLHREIDNRDDAIASIKESLKLFESMSREHPESHRLKVGIASANIEMGWVYWNDGRLAEADRTWRTGIEVWRNALSQDQEKGKSRKELADTYSSISEAYARMGLWADAAKLRHESDELRGKTETFDAWRQRGTLAYHSGDVAGYRRIVAQVINDFRTSEDSEILYNLAWLGAWAPDSGIDPEILVSLAKQADDGTESWRTFAHALAQYRAGHDEEAIKLVEKRVHVPQDWQLVTGIGWGLLALAHHRLGHTEQARFALDRLEDVHVRSAWRALSQGGSLPASDSWMGSAADWWDHAQLEELRIEATQQILGKPAAEAAPLTVARGLVLAKLERTEQAEAEFAASVSAHPNDPDALLARGRAFDELGLKERAEADFSRAEELPAHDVRPWIEIGRYLAQTGDRKRSDLFLKRAAQLAPDQPSRFLEPGWWVVGPFPRDLPTPQSIITNPDPSLAVTGADGKPMIWRSAPAGLDLSATPPSVVNRGGMPIYAHTLVYANKERASLIHIDLQNNWFSVWLNGELVIDPAMKLVPKRFRDAIVPVTLRTGRNSLVVKANNPNARLQLRFDDFPEDRGALLGQLGLWDEATAAWDLAENQGTLSLEAWLRRPWLAAGRGDAAGYRLACNRIMAKAEPPYMAFVAMSLGARPDSGVDPARLKELGERIEKANPRMESWVTNGPLWAAYRNGEYGRVLELAERFPGQSKFSGNLPILAMAHHQLGHAEEARRYINKFSKETSDARQRQSDGSSPFDEEWYRTALTIALQREARTLIEGTPDNPSADIGPVLAKAREVYRSLDPDSAAYEIAVMLEPRNPLYRKALDDRWAELGRIDQAIAHFVKRLDLAPNERINYSRRSILLLGMSKSPRAFARLLELRPTDDSLWSARARNRALRGQWNEAAADFAHSAGSSPIASEEQFEFACARLLSGDEPGYRSAIHKMSERWGESKEGSATFVLARSACLWPSSGIESDRIVRWAEQAVAGERSPWKVHVLGLACYRAGDDARALKLIEESLASNTWSAGDMLNKVVLAMVHQRMGEPTKARALLEEVRNSVRRIKNEAVSGMVEQTTTDWFPLQILLPEAEALIDYDAAFPANPFAR